MYIREKIIIVLSKFEYQKEWEKRLPKSKNYLCTVSVVEMDDEIQIRPPKSKVDANSNQEMKYSMLDCMRYSVSVHLLYHGSDNHSRTPSILPYMRPYQYLLLIFKNGYQEIWYFIILHTKAMWKEEFCLHNQMNSHDTDYLAFFFENKHWSKISCSSLFFRRGIKFLAKCILTTYAE